MYKFIAVFAAKFIHPKNDPFLVIHKKKLVANSYLMFLRKFKSSAPKSRCFITTRIHWKKRLRERSENALKNQAHLFL